MTAASAPLADPQVNGRSVFRWLVLLAVMTLAMIVIGGATRLTESGLSITEWKPVSGVVPPLSADAWNAEFVKYQQIPQYTQMNPDMTLGEFKSIYLWEYTHRLLARLVGLVVVIPLVVFLVRKRISRELRTPVLAIAGLFLLQAAMGWWMVKSGLTHRTEVSQYRLALHLLTALTLLGLCAWTADRVRTDVPSTGKRRSHRLLTVLAALVALTATSGALVAGLRAGKIYNAFPYMGEGLVPPGYAQLTPWYLNIFENHAAVQFNHRLLATTTVLFALLAFVALRTTTNMLLKRRMNLVLAAALLQFTLGIATLLLHVPITLGVAHQGVAALFLVSVLLAMRASRIPGFR